jgi:type II secretory pathway pseudopilin PulG
MRKLTQIFSLLRSESGFTLLEVAFAGAIMVIIGLAYLGTISQSISISQLYTEQNQANLLIEQEIEVLRNTPFNNIPFRQSSAAEKLIEVPDYYNNVAVTVDDPTKPGFIGSTGDSIDYEKDHVFDGLRSGEGGVNRWMASVNGPLKTGGFIPQTDEPIIVVPPGDPDTDIIINPGDSNEPPDLSADSQMAYIVFPKITKIHRIIYDNRFNISGDDMLPNTHWDYFNHRYNIWQRDYKIFVSQDEDVLPGLPFRPEFNDYQVIFEGKGLGYGSTGLIDIYNNIEEPLEASVLGVGNISVETDFDPSFHYPYASELEAYGFNNATNYVESYNVGSSSVHVGNYIMFMPNYNKSNYDMFRRVYLVDGDAEFPPLLNKQPVFRVELKLYPHDKNRNTDKFVRESWWQDNKEEVMGFTFTISREGDILFDNLPGLQDLPKHTYYYNNENIYLNYTVPGASKIRGHFNKFDIQNYPDTDYVQFYDKDGTLYGNDQYYGNQISAFSVGPYSPWVNGDTLVIHFVSDDYLSSIPNGNLGGFEVDHVEIK